jgi:copper chaperone CopZ
MTVQLAIDGMSCGHCVARVKRALEQVPGATVGEVTVGTATVDIDPAETSPDALVQAVDRAGYPARIAS